jgi:hypothetical protein
MSHILAQSCPTNTITSVRKRNFHLSSAPFQFRTRFVENGTNTSMIDVSSLDSAVASPHLGISLLNSITYRSNLASVVLVILDAYINEEKLELVSTR